MSDLDRLYDLLTAKTGITRKRDSRLEVIARDRALEARQAVGLIVDGSDGIPHPIDQLTARTWPLQGTFKGVWENAAWSYGYPDPMQSFVDGWWNSTAHHVNLVRPEATSWGIGIYTETPADGVTRFYAITVFTKDLLMSAVVCSGTSFADALGAGPLASKLGAPILLTEKSVLPDATRDALVALDPTEIIIIGGLSVIDAAVQTELAAIAPVRRIAGADRYATAALVAAA